MRSRPPFFTIQFHFKPEESSHKLARAHCLIKIFMKKKIRYHQYFLSFFLVDQKVWDIILRWNSPSFTPLTVFRFLRYTSQLGRRSSMNFARAHFIINTFYDFFFPVALIFSVVFPGQSKRLGHDIAVEKPLLTPLTVFCFSAIPALSGEVRALTKASVCCCTYCCTAVAHGGWVGWWVDGFVCGWVCRVVCGWCLVGELEADVVFVRSLRGLAPCC